MAMHTIVSLPSYYCESGLEICRESGQHGKQKNGMGTLHYPSRGTGIPITTDKESPRRGREPSTYPLVVI